MLKPFALLVVLVLIANSPVSAQDDPLLSVSIENSSGVLHASAGLSNGYNCKAVLKNCPFDWACDNASFATQFDLGVNILGAKGGENKVSVFATAGNNVNTDASITRDGVQDNFENSIVSLVYGAGASYTRYFGRVGISGQYRALRLLTGEQRLDNQQGELLNIGSNNYGSFQVGLKIRLGRGSGVADQARRGLDSVEDGFRMLDEFRRRIEEERRSN